MKQTIIKQSFKLLYWWLHDILQLFKVAPTTPNIRFGENITQDIFYNNKL